MEKNYLFIKVILIVTLVLLIGSLCYTQNKERSEDEKITLEKAKKYFDEAIPFIDIRSQKYYDSEHIAGSLNLELDNLEENIEKLSFLKDFVWGNCPCAMKSYKDPKEVCVLYGSNGDKANLTKTAAELRKHYFKKVYIMKDGFESWQKAGYPVITSTEE